MGDRHQSLRRALSDVKPAWFHCSTLFFSKGLVGRYSFSFRCVRYDSAKSVRPRHLWLPGLLNWGLEYCTRIFCSGIRIITQNTDWFKHVARNLLSIQCPARFWEIDPEIWHVRILWSPARPVCFFSGQICSFSYIFRWFLGLKGSKPSGENQITPFVNGFEGTRRIGHVCNQSGPISKKRRGHLDFCAENTCNLSSCLVINRFQHIINFGR